jgi:hypothetical protein
VEGAGGEVDDGETQGGVMVWVSARPPSCTPKYSTMSVRCVGCVCGGGGGSNRIEKHRGTSERVCGESGEQQERATQGKDDQR